METFEQTKLNMINDCLETIGEVPLPLDTLVDPEYDSNGNIIVFSDIQEGTDASIARDIVLKTMYDVQNRGWAFNTEYNYKFLPDSNGMIPLSKNILRVDVGKTILKGKIIRKSGRLYNLDTQSFIFTEPLYADVVWLVDYTDLTHSAFRYISLRASTSFEKKVIASPTLDKLAQFEEQRALSELEREDLQTRDFNLNSNRTTRRYHNSRI